MNVAVFELVEMDQPKIITDLGLTLRFGDVLHPHSELDVLRDREPGEEAELLENQNSVRSRPLHRGVIDQDIARGLLVEAGDQMKQRGLSAAGWADDAEEFAGLDLQINIFERDEPMVRIGGVAQTHVLERQLRHLDPAIKSCDRGDICAMRRRRPIRSTVFDRKIGLAKWLRHWTGCFPSSARA